MTEIKKLKELLSVSHPIIKPVIKLEIQFHENKLAEHQGAKCREVIEQQMSMLSEDGG